MARVCAGIEHTRRIICYTITIQDENISSLLFGVRRSALVGYERSVQPDDGVEPRAISISLHNALSRSANARWRLCNGAIHLHGSGDRLLEVISQAWRKRKANTVIYLFLARLPKRAFALISAAAALSTNVWDVSGDASRGGAPRGTQMSCVFFVFSDNNRFLSIIFITLNLPECNQGRGERKLNLNWAHIKVFFPPKM